MFVHHVHAVPEEVRRGHQIVWTWMLVSLSVGAGSSILGPLEEQPLLLNIDGPLKNYICCLNLN